MIGHRATCMFAFVLCSAAPAFAQSPVKHKAANDKVEEAIQAITRQVQVRESCSDTCFSPVFVIPSAKAVSQEQLCFENPYLQSFRTQDGEELTGILAEIFLDHEDGYWLKEGLLLILTEDKAGELIRGTVCAPTQITSGDMSFGIRKAEYPVADVASVGGLFGTVGGLIGSHAGLAGWLFGHEKREIIEIDVRSSPAGATLIMNGEPTEFTTDSILSIPSAFLDGLRVRYNRKEQQVKLCPHGPGNGRGIVFLCRFNR